MKYLISIIFAIVASVSHAATVNIYKYSDGSHYVILSGGIVSGDLQRLRTALNDYRVRNQNTTHLWLNSQGGNQGEGIAIYKYLRQSAGISTIVDAGDRCMSACAVIWTARPSNQRIFRRGARIGYHIGSYDSVQPMIDRMNRAKPTWNLVDVQTAIQNDFSSDIEFYRNMRTNRPFEVAYHIANEGYNAFNFWEPNNHQLKNVVGAIEWR